MSTRESFTATIDGQRFRITLAPDGPDADRVLTQADAKLTAMTEHRDVLAELLERERNALARLRAKHGQACSRLAVVRRAMAGKRQQDAYEHALVRAMARRCGLEDPDSFEPTACPNCGSEDYGRSDGSEHAVGTMVCYGCNCAGPERGTGRTTRMLLEALCAVAVGCHRVQVMAADRLSAVDLRKRLHDLVECGGVTVESPAILSDILLVTWPGGPLVKGPVDVRLVDHAAQEAHAAARWCACSRFDGCQADKNNHIERLGACRKNGWPSDG